MTSSATILGILRQRQDIHDIYFAENPEPGDITIDFFGGPKLFDEQCIFDTCDAATAQSLLIDFIHHKSVLGWAVNCELMKLLAAKGTLVAKLVDPIVFSPVSESFAPRFMFFSYLACMPRGEKHCLEFLELLPEDFRDGLFLACYRLNTMPIYQKLVIKFCEWTKDEEWGHGTGERHALSRFIERWDMSFPNGPHSCLKRFVS